MTKSNESITMTMQQLKLVKRGFSPEHRMGMTAHATHWVRR
jgi:hypothetical protein